MMGGFKLSENYALDWGFFYKVRGFDDGLTVIAYELNGDWYRGDHNPKFVCSLKVFNFMIWEFVIYNVNHVDDEDEEDDEDEDDN